MLIYHTSSYINQEAIIALLLDTSVVYIILNFFLFVNLNIKHYARIATSRT